VPEPGATFKAIADRVGKDQTTISKEVKRHIKVNPGSTKKYDRHGNPITTICPLLVKAPFVCNPCRKRHAQCGLQKQRYNAKAARFGRTFDDFLAFIEENAATHWTEKDTIIDRVGGKVIMTFDFTLCNFMFGLFLNE